MLRELQKQLQTHDRMGMMVKCLGIQAKESFSNLLKFQLFTPAGLLPVMAFLFLKPVYSLLALPFRAVSFPLIRKSHLAYKILQDFEMGLRSAVVMPIREEQRARGRSSHLRCQENEASVITKCSCLFPIIQMPNQIFKGTPEIHVEGRYFQQADYK